MTDDITARARRRTRSVVAVGLLCAAVLILLAALVLVTVDGGHRDGASAGPDGGPAQWTAISVGPPPPTAAVSSAATFPAGDLRWVTVAGASVPVSRSAGPRELTDGRARGFARTPLGAVLAAAHISVRLCPQAGPAVFGATLRDQVVGANTATLARSLDDDYQQARAQMAVPYGDPAGRLYSTTRGYRLDAVSADAATVRLLLEGPGSQTGSVLVDLVVHMQWVGTDWALVAPAGGDWDDDALVVTDATGYTRFPDGD